MIPVVPDYDRVAANSVTEAGARALQALQRPLIIDQQQPGLDPNPGCFPSLLAIFCHKHVVVFGVGALVSFQSGLVLGSALC